jgi:hypothetical protein
MKKFIHEKNIRLFRKRLAEGTDPEKRQILLKPLAEEEANCAQTGRERNCDIGARLLRCRVGDV